MSLNMQKVQTNKAQNAYLYAYQHLSQPTKSFTKRKFTLHIFVYTNIFLNLQKFNLKRLKINICVYININISQPTTNPTYLCILASTSRSTLKYSATSSTYNKKINIKSSNSVTCLSSSSLLLIGFSQA
jgi:hypothetical protein